MSISSIEDLRCLARRRVPRMFYEYADGGSWSEATYRANEADFANLLLRQRVGINLEQRSTAASVLGQAVRMPLALAPCGLTGMMHADGEILAARAAERFGVPYTLSTMSICSIEDVARHTSKPFWFQLYLMKDRAFVDALIARARAAGCSALVLTLDLNVFGERLKDMRNGLTVPPRINLSNLTGMMRRPGWCLGMLGTRRHRFGNLAGHTGTDTSLSALAAWTSAQFDATLSWDDIGWIKQRWGGKLIVKGIMDAQDARHAVESGADALVVSNHGGRQLDGTCSTIRALPAIVDAVASQIEVHLDGGVRCGQDVLRALALGARAVHIGRPYLYGLGALGEQGVTRCLEILHRELDLTMAMCGLRDITQADRDLLLPARA